MIQKVFDYIEENNMLLPNDVVVVGVSGGADSVCLLYLLDEVRQSIPFSLYVVHVNHGVRKEAKEEAEYVKRICREKDIPFFLMESNIKIVAKEEGISEEEAGRELRYRSFRSVLKEVGKEREGKIAVAHNKNDNAETMLLNLFRGSGLTGLQGILPVRDNIIRPLLCIERHEIEEYLRKRNIPFCNDKTNFETVYTRNKIRNKLLPIVLSIFPSSISKMSESSRLVTQANSFIEEFAKEKMKNAILHQESGVIWMDIPRLLEEQEIIQNYILRDCIEVLTNSKKDISLAHINSIRELLNKQVGKTVMLPYQISVKRDYQKLVFIQGNTELFYCSNREEEKKYRKETLITEEDITYTILDHFELLNIQEKRYTKWMDYDRIEKSLKLRKRQSGDYLYVANEQKQSLKSYMINQKIPKQMRDEIWLLADGNHIVWIIGYRISYHVRITSETKRILQVQIRGEHRDV